MESYRGVPQLGYFDNKDKNWECQQLLLGMQLHVHVHVVAISPSFSFDRVSLIVDTMFFVFVCIASSLNTHNVESDR